jgi:hypothetical protein
MSADREAIDHFGRLVTLHLRDALLDHFDRLASSFWKTPSLQALQAALATLPPDHLALARRAVVSATDAAIHDFLFSLQEQADFENRIRLTVDGIDIVAASDGIHGEAYSEDGWYARFSAFGEPPEEA